MPSEFPAEPAGSIQVDVSNLQSALPLDVGWIEGIVARTLRAQGVEQAEVSVAVVDDASIRVINARHLGHDWATDVVSFPFGAPGDADFGGEVVISAETAAREAMLRRVPPRDEFALYVVHGLLHLCGFDDQTEADARAMHDREGALLRAQGIESPFERRQARSGTSE